MPSLLDAIDRLSLSAKEMESVADTFHRTPSGQPKPTSGPFARAVLDTHLGDLVREADPSEIGLFTLVPPTSSSAPRNKDNATGSGELTRVEFTGATPLKRLPGGGRKGDMKRKGDHEPEVYLEAALKYMDRFRSVRPMPQARAQAISLLEEVYSMQENTQTLNEALEEASHPPEPQIDHDAGSFGSKIVEEEKKVQALSERLAELRKKKATLLREKERRIRSPAKRRLPSSADSHSRLGPSSSRHSQVTDEDEFWNTPSTKSKRPKFAEEALLMDEDVEDLGNVTVTFSSPWAEKSKKKERTREKRSMKAEKTLAYKREMEIGLETEPTHEEEAISTDLERTFEVDEMEEDTVVLTKPPLSEPEPQHEREPNPDFEPRRMETPPSPLGSIIELDEVPTEPMTPSSKRTSKVRITSEMERVVAKIWASVGTLIHPGAPYDVEAAPPKAKETLAYFQALSTTPTPVSPSASSTASFPSSSTQMPTTDQVLLGTLLLILLQSPSLSKPLGEIKEELGKRTGDEGIIGGAGARATKTLYACVAKRLLKIDRGSRQQIVSFDVSV